MKNKIKEENKTLNGRISNVLESAWRKVKSFFYEINVIIYHKLRKNKPLKQRSFSSNDRAAKIFYACIIVLPLLQFLIFYIFVNFNSIILAFQEYNMDLGEFQFLGFDNFSKFFTELFHDSAMIIRTKNSFTLYFVGLIIGLPLNLIFSYFMYKKVPMSGFFKVILFLPQIISTMVVSLMFKFFIDDGLQGIMALFNINNFPNLLFDKNTAFPTMVFYCIWGGFGTQILIYTSSMSRVPESLVEYGELEGITMLKEFIFVTLPLIFPTITTFLVTGVASIFTHQAGLYDFFSKNADQNVQTFGYFLFAQIVGDANIVNYPYAAAAGLAFTCFAAPITILVKYLLEKFVPSAEY